MGIDTNQLVDRRIAVCVVTLLAGGADARRTPRRRQLKDLGARRDQATRSRSASPLVDYEAIKDFVDFERGDTGGDQQGLRRLHQQQRWRRRPQDRAGATRSTRRSRAGRPTRSRCARRGPRTTSVFAVLGVFIDFTGQGQLCLTKEHDVDPHRPRARAAVDRRVAAGPAAHARHHQGERGRGARDPAHQRPASSRARPSAVVGRPGQRGPGQRRRRPGTEEGQGQDRLDGGAEHHRHRHHGGAGPARQLHREVEDRGRRHACSWPATACRRSSSSRRSRTAHAERPAASPTPTPPLEQARTRSGRGHDPEPVRGDAQRHRAARSPSAGRTRARSCSSASTSTRRRPATTVPGPDERRGHERQGKTDQHRPAVTDFCGELFMFKDIAEKVGPNLTIEELAEDGRTRSARSTCRPTSRVALQGQVRGRGQLPAGGVRLERRRRPATGRR